MDLVDDEDDEQLRLAIALSLQEQLSSQRDQTSKARSPSRDIIDLTESDDEELLRAIELSKQVDDEPPTSNASSDPRPEPHVSSSSDVTVDQKPEIATTESSSSASSSSQCTTSHNANKSEDSNDATKAQGTNAFGLLGIDRKKLEEERLARLANRKRSAVSPPPIQRPSKLASDAGRLQFAGKPMASKAINTSKEVQYPFGTIKKTWARGQARDDDIKIEEVLQKEHLQMALLSAFQWDVEWLLGKVDINRTKLIFAMQAKTESTKHQYMRETAHMRNLRLCFPPMDAQVNCMHSKLMILSYPSSLRIVVSSANLVPYDWGETGVMENMVFLIDLPRIGGVSVDIEREETKSTIFQQELFRFLNAMTVPKEIIASLHRFDFSNTEKLGFVHSIGGSHIGDDCSTTGYCGLGRVVKALGMSTDEELDVDYVTASVGALDEGFLVNLYRAAQGNDDSKNLISKTSKRDVKSTDEGQLKKDFRVYYPTKDSIQRSIGGPSNAGTICFQSSWFNRAHFPRSVMRDCVSTREGLLMHNKIMYVRPKLSELRISSSKVRNFKSIAWAYVGSANLSESAWGKLVKDRATKLLKLNLRNWECGVIVPVSMSQHSEHTQQSQGDSKKQESMGFDVFNGVVPVPMKTPASEYGDRKPWYHLEG